MKRTPAPGSQPAEPANPLKRIVLMWILALSWASSGAGWALMETLGQSSPVLLLVFGANLVFHPTVFVIARKRLPPQRAVDFSCPLFAAGLCAACMALRLYAPDYVHHPVAYRVGRAGRRALFLLQLPAPLPGRAAYPRRAGAHGQHGRTDQAGQSPAHDRGHRGHRGRAAPVGPLRPPVRHHPDGHRSLQGYQRPVRSRRRRRRIDGAVPALRRDAARRRPDGPLGRRGIRDRPAGDRLRAEPAESRVAVPACGGRAAG